MRQPKTIYIKHGAKYMGLCDLEVYNNAPKTRYGNVESSVEVGLPSNYYFGNSSPCEYKVLKRLSAEMEDKEFERITQTLKCDNIQYVAYLSKTGEYL